jgi:hypothetical protein
VIAKQLASKFSISEGEQKMKRISTLTAAILLAAPAVSHARYYIPLRCRVRYSPYAFSRYNNGLIPGNIHYSPYAFSCNSTGLVPDNVRYSPYAFGTRSSGLVADWWCYSSYYAYSIPYVIRYYSYQQPAVVQQCGEDCPNSSDDNNSSSVGSVGLPYEQELRAHKQKIRQLKESRKEINSLRQQDGKEIICNYLKSKNIDFDMNRLLKIDNITLSVDFLLRDKNTIIKYWNPDDIQRIAQEPGYKKNFYERYKQNWIDYYRQYKRAGGKVFYIAAANKEEILDKLANCKVLTDG